MTRGRIRPQRLLPGALLQSEDVHAGALIYNLPSIQRVGASRIARTAAQACASLLIMLLASSCAVRLVSDFDQRTEQLASEIHEHAAGLLQELREEAAPACGYAAHAEDHRDLAVKASSLRLRAGSIERNEQTTNAAIGLAEALSSFKSAHQFASSGPNAGCMKPELIETTGSGIDSAVGGILKLELAKKGR